MEIISLSEVSEVKTGTKNRENNEENGLYPFYTRSQNILKSSEYTIDDEAIIIPGEGIFIPIWHSGKAAVHQRTYIVKSSDNKRLLNKYLYYWWSKNKIILDKSAVGSTVKSLRKFHFLNPKIKLPSILYQLDIIAIIEPFERLLEITNKKIELLIKLGDKLIELVKNECCLKNLSNITAGSSPPQFPEYWENGNIPFLNIKDLTNTPIITKVDSFITDLAFKKYNCKKIDKYSVLIGKVSPDKDKISLSTIDSVVNGAIRIIKPFQKENAFQLFFALRNKSDYIKKIATGSVQQQINSNQLYNLLIKFDTKMNNYFILLFKLLFILEKIKNKLKSIIRNIVKIYVK